MQKTVFIISKMDCSSEEHMIRMKLYGLKNIKSLNFDLQKRKLEVIHTEDYNEIFSKLNSLKLDTKFIVSESINSYFPNQDDKNDSKILWQVLSINFFFFIFEVISGFLASSMGLVSDSLDMLADSIVYGLALYAVSRSVHHKKNIAKLSGYFQMFLAILGILEIIRRFLELDETPLFQTMIGVSFLALIGNIITLYLLQKSKSKEAHMQASIIFTSNDVIINIGVIVAGILVLFTNSKFPDLIIGLIILAVVVRGAFRILQLSK